MSSIARLEIGLLGEQPFVNRVLNSGETPGSKRKLLETNFRWLDGHTQVNFIIDTTAGRAGLGFRILSSRPDAMRSGQRSREAAPLYLQRFMPEPFIYDHDTQRSHPIGDSRNRVFDLVHRASEGGFSVLDEYDQIQQMAAMVEVKP